MEILTAASTAGARRSTNCVTNRVHRSVVTGNERPVKPSRRDVFPFVCSPTMTICKRFFSQTHPYGAPRGFYCLGKLTWGNDTSRWMPNSRYLSMMARVLTRFASSKSAAEENFPGVGLSRSTSGFWTTILNDHRVRHEMSHFREHDQF